MHCTARVKGPKPLEIVRPGLWHGVTLGAAGPAACDARFGTEVASPCPSDPSARHISLEVEMFEYARTIAKPFADGRSTARVARGQTPRLLISALGSLMWAVPSPCLSTNKGIVPPSRGTHGARVAPPPRAGQQAATAPALPRPQQTARDPAADWMLVVPRFVNPTVIHSTSAYRRIRRRTSARSLL